MPIYSVWIGPIYAIARVIELNLAIDLIRQFAIQWELEKGIIPMTPEQKLRLITLLAKKRTESQLSANEVARRANIDPGTVSRIEQGMIPTPKAESLRAIGKVLGIPAIDLFTAVGWVPEDELPTLDVYFHAKYPGLPDEAVAAIASYAIAVVERYGVTNNGPSHTAAIAEPYGVNITDGPSPEPEPEPADSLGGHVDHTDTPARLPEEYDLLITVTNQGVAVQISDHATNAITHEQNDLDDIWEGLIYVARVAGSKGEPVPPGGLLT